MTKMNLINKGKCIFQNKNIIENTIYMSYSFMMTIIVLICLFLGNTLYITKINHISNIFLIPIGIFIFFIIFLLSKILKQKLKNIKYKPIIILIVSIIFLMIQIYFAYCYWFKTGWDVATIISSSQAASIDMPINSFYFSKYPNNLFLVYVFSRIFKCVNIVNTIANIEIDAYFIIIILQCFLWWITGLILCHCTYKLTKSYTKTLMAYILYFFIVLLSPWVTVPYSDAIGLIFPILIFWLYLIQSKKLIINLLKWFFIGSFAYIGYKIKPQIFIIIIAMILIEMIHFMFNYKINIKKVARNSLSFLTGLSMAFLIVAMSINSLNANIDSNQTYGITHFLMMGMNTNKGGIYSQEDVEFSGSFANSKERKENNLKVAIYRIKKMGILGFIKHMTNKTLTNYNDGTFAWAIEGNFYLEIHNDKNEILSPILKNVFYLTNGYGKYYNIWINFSQCIWISVLTCSLFIMISKKNRFISVLLLSIIGLTVFELIFEARSRYLFIYSPIYIIIGTIGFYDLLIFIKLKLKEKKLCMKVD